MYQKYFFVLLFCALPMLALEKVSLQLKWYHQFQFAGYYAALQQGYYREEGLEVTIKNRNPDINNIDQVLNGESEYGIGDSVLLLYQAQKKPIAIVAPIFQHSPNVFITLKSSGIDSPYKMIGKRVALYPNDADGLALLAMLYETGVTKQGFVRVQTHFDISELTSQKVDATHGYATNEPHTLREKGFEVNIIYPQNFGVDFYGDILFTTQDELSQHPQRVAAMKRATIRGWQYAIAHKKEIIQLIRTKYRNTQSPDKLAFEADGIIAAIDPSSVPIGTLNSGRLDYIRAMLERHGLIGASSSLDQSIYRDAQGIRLKVLEYITLDQIVIIVAIFFILLIILIYNMRKLRNQKQELSRMSERLKRAKDAAEDSARSKSEFLAAMSHEIRTPMNGVLGMLELLERSSLDGSQKHQLHIATSSATSLLGLINDILDFSKIEAGKMDLENLEFNLHAELQEFTDAMAFKAQEKSLELILNTTKIHYPNIITDPGRLRQILTNLVSNALKFTPSGLVIIDASLDPLNDHYGRLRIDVIDSGIGIPAEQIDKLFEAFTQADGSTTRKYGGTGLGLSIVKQLCELMGGSVHATSIPGNGSTFSIDLTLKLGNNTSIPSLHSFMTHARIDEEVVWPSQTRILLVEDNPTNQIVAQGLLQTIGLTCDTAANGLEAIESIKNATQTLPYSLILMDCQMPVMDGYDSTRAVRAGQAGSSNTKIPIIAMTANAMSGDREKCILAGMDDYLTKPIDIATLKETLIKWLLGKEIKISNPAPEAKQPTELLLWDEQEALGRMGGNGELLCKIIQSFLRDSDNLLNALRTAIQNENFSDAQLHAHSIKGSAGNIAAHKLQAISKLLEEAAKNKNSALLNEQFAPCEETLKATVDLLKKYAITQNRPTKKPKRLDPLKMATTLQKLKNDVASGMLIDTASLGIFGVYTDTALNTQLDTLKIHIEKFETDSAITLIDTIMAELE